MQGKNYLQQGAIAASLNPSALTLSSNEVIQKQQKGFDERNVKDESVRTHTFTYGGWMGYRGGYEGL